MQTVLLTLQRLADSLPYLAITLALLMLGKVVYSFTFGHKFREQLLEKDNPALGVCFAGYFIGLGIAIAGSLFGADLDHVPPMNIVGVGLNPQGLLVVLVGGLSAIVLMRLSILVNEKLILYRFSIDKEMTQDRNVGTALVVAGSCLATGLMLNGVLSGPSDSLWTGLLDTAVYWVAGQAILIVGALVFQRVAGYDVQATIEVKDSIPAGISFGGFLVGLGIIARASLAGAGPDIPAQLAITGILAVAGILILLAVHFVVGRLFFAHSPLAKEVVSDNNAAAGAVSAAAFIGVAILIAATYFAQLQGTLR